MIMQNMIENSFCLFNSPLIVGEKLNEGNEFAVLMLKSRESTKSKNINQATFLAFWASQFNFQLIAYAC